MPYSSPHHIIINNYDVHLLFLVLAVDRVDAFAIKLALNRNEKIPNTRRKRRRKNQQMASIYHCNLWFCIAVHVRALTEKNGICVECVCACAPLLCPKMNLLNWYGFTCLVGCMCVPIKMFSTSLRPSRYHVPSIYHIGLLVPTSTYDLHLSCILLFSYLCTRHS